MSITKVPDRFLGFAFTVGDILLEIDNDFFIHNADGALSVLSNEDETILADKNIKELMSSDDYELFKITCKGLDKTSRIGPFVLNLGLTEDSRAPFALFAGRLPMMKDKIFLAISYPYRLGLQSDEMDDLTDEEKKDQFFKKLDTMLHQSAGSDEHLMVTVLETVQESELTPGKQKEMEKFLKTFSVGGTASRLSSNKFALIHDKGDNDDQSDLITQNLRTATGLDITSASLNARVAADETKSEDSIKALVFSLQQFAEGNDSYDIEQFKEKGKDLINETSQKVTAFREILDTGKFSFVYQPIVSLRSGTTHHFEALSRFDASGFNAGQFEMICFAEDVGLIMDFDMAVLKRAIDKVKPQMGMASAPRIAVNLSGKSLSNAKFIDELLTLLKKTPSLSRNISLEVTESAKINDLEMLNKVLTEIRKVGYKVYLDDFGAGASGFQYLKQLVVDGVKIDGEYVRDATTDKTTRAFLQSMATLCQNIGVETVAEWVESKEQMELLQRLGVNYGQGYYFGKPSDSLTPARARTA